MDTMEGKVGLRRGEQENTGKKGKTKENLKMPAFNSSIFYGNGVKM